MINMKSTLVFTVIQKTWKKNFVIIIFCQLSNCLILPLEQIRLLSINRQEGKLTKRVPIGSVELVFQTYFTCPSQASYKVVMMDKSANRMLTSLKRTFLFFEVIQIIPDTFYSGSFETLNPL